MMEAPNAATQIKAALSAVIAFGTALFGMTGWVVIIWLTAMVIDYLTGTWAAIAHGEWSSKLARQGLWHKLGAVAAICVAALSDIALGVVITQLAGDILPFEYPVIITPVVCLWYILTECGSIIENAVKLGAPVPKWLVKMIASFRNGIDRKQDALIPDEEDEKE